MTARVFVGRYVVLRRGPRILTGCVNRLYADGSFVVRMGSVHSKATPGEVESVHVGAANAIARKRELEA